MVVLNLFLSLFSLILWFFFSADSAPPREQLFVFGFDFGFSSPHAKLG